MSAAQIIHSLEAMGFRVGLTEAGNIRLERSRTPTPQDAEALTDALRACKEEAIGLLKARRAGFYEIMPEQGEAREVVINPVNESEMRRWKKALDAGLIALDGKVRYHVKDNIVRLCYRTTMPHEWLEDAMKSQAAQQYHGEVGENADQLHRHMHSP